MAASQLPDAIRLPLEDLAWTVPPRPLPVSQLHAWQAAVHAMDSTPGPACVDVADRQVLADLVVVVQASEVKPARLASWQGAAQRVLLRNTLTRPADL